MKRWIKTGTMGKGPPHHGRKMADHPNNGRRDDTVLVTGARNAKRHRKANIQKDS